MDINNSVLELIEKYPILSKYMVNTNGILSITTEGYEHLSEALIKTSNT
jgi:hypothetical protein